MSVGLEIEIRVSHHSKRKAERGSSGEPSYPQLPGFPLTLDCGSIYSYSWVENKLLGKLTMSHQSSPVRMAILKKTTNNRCW